MTVNSIPTIAHECAKSMTVNFMADSEKDLVSSSFVSTVQGCW